MGAGASSIKRCFALERTRRLPPGVRITDDLQRLINRWKLTDYEIGYFFDIFSTLDKHKTGTIEFDEFFSFLNEDRSRFQDTMFEFIARAYGEELDFPKWMVSVFTFAFATPSELTEQVFEAYDTTRSGFWTKSDLRTYLRQMHSDNMIFPADVIIAMMEIVAKRKGRLEYDEFQRACNKYPQLTWPLFKTQRDIRQKLIGSRMFEVLDRRTGDIYFASAVPQMTFAEKWMKRKEHLKLYLCGLPCCWQTGVSLEDDWKDVWGQAGKKRKRAKKNAPEDDPTKHRQQEKRLQDALHASDDSESDEFTEVEANEFDDAILL